MSNYKIVKKWVAPHYRKLKGKRVYVRGHYIKVRIYVPDKIETKMKREKQTKMLISTIPILIFIITISYIYTKVFLLFEKVKGIEINDNYFNLFMSVSFILLCILFNYENKLKKESENKNEKRKTIRKTTNKRE